MHSPTGPPPVKEAPGGSTTNVTALIAALVAMVARLMTRTITVEHIIDIDRHIKLFLSAYEKFDLANRNSNDTPSWITSYNFCCLLNYPELIEEFGPLRNLWEGGGMGEKILRLVKPSWNGFRKNWQLNKMDKVLRKMAMIKLQSASLKEEQMDKFIDDDDDDDDDDDSDDEGNAKFSANDMFGGLTLFRRYSSELEVKSHFDKRLPLSVVRLVTEGFCCILKNEGLVRIQCKKLKDGCFGAAYHTWQLIPCDGAERHVTDIDDVVNFCILLPKLSQRGMPNKQPGDPVEEAIYTLIDSEWNAIDSDGNIVLPKLDGATYSY